MKISADIPSNNYSIQVEKLDYRDTGSVDYYVTLIYMGKEIRSFSLDDLREFTKTAEQLSERLK